MPINWRPRRWRYAPASRLILSPQTIGPFSRQPHSWLAARACRQAEVIFVRDPLSLAVLQKLAPGVDARQVIDVAFALPYTPAERTVGGPIRVGINPSGLLLERRLQRRQ